MERVPEFILVSKSKRGHLYARAPMEMKEATDALQLKGVQVAFNGGLIYTIGNHHQVLPIHVQTIKHKTVKQLLRGIRQHFPGVS